MPNEPCCYEIWASEKMSPCRITLETEGVKPSFKYKVSTFCSVNSDNKKPTRVNNSYSFNKKFFKVHAAYQKGKFPVNLSFYFSSVCIQKCLLRVQVTFGVGLFDDPNEHHDRQKRSEDKDYLKSEYHKVLKRRKYKILERCGGNNFISMNTALQKFSRKHKA